MGGWMEDKSVLIEREKILVPERSAGDDYSLMTTGRKDRLCKKIYLSANYIISWYINKSLDS